MYKRAVVILVFCCLVTLVMVACGSAASSTGGPSVHMNDTNFVQSSVTIKKGERLTLIADTFTAHIVANGTWNGATAQPGKESGAPLVANVQISGNSSTVIGPFNTDGTFRLYCTIHQGMNLTVMVN